MLFLTSFIIICFQIKSITNCNKLLSDFRINASREFFTNKCLPYVDKIIDIHELIQKRACG
mgnify:CR=1 FL=1